MKRKNIKETIRDYFFTNPTSKLRVREMERKLHLPLPSIIRYCAELEKDGILRIIKIGGIRLYNASGSDKYHLEKKLFNIRQLYESGLVQFLKIQLSNPVILLFGSYSKGEDIEKSDIDLYVETFSDKKLNLENYERVLRREIQLFRATGIKTINNHNLANNIINGIKLNGQIEVFN